jgi:hypothetical protein
VGIDFLFYLAGSLIMKTQKERDRDHAAEHGEEHGAEDEHDGKCGCEGT